MISDEEDAAINAAIESDPEETAGKVVWLTEDELRKHFPITAKYIIASRRRDAAAKTSRVSSPK